LRKKLPANAAHISAGIVSQKTSLDDGYGPELNIIVIFSVVLFF